MEKDLMEQYIIDNIDTAIENGYIRVYYQPVIRVATGKVTGWEALARWDDPQKGLLNPGLFIDVLEKNNLIHKLDAHIIELVFADYRHVIERKGQLETCSINLSRLDFKLIDVFELIDNKRQEYGIPKEILRFEITESVMIDDPDFVKEQIDKFHAYGYTIWMDDFGSGYSSLNVLRKFDFDLIKIDMKFLHNLETDSHGKIMLYHLINMIKEMGMLTLAEGVETRDQYNLLKRLGCDGVQGFLFGRPLPTEQIRANIIQKGLEFETDEERDFYSGNDVATIRINGLAAFDNFLDLVPMGVFWKDSKRRFLGANKMFLEYYNLESVDDILGKTDEDMGWHINPEPFRSDELKVINQKEEIINAPGKCIVNGMVRDIKATKKPFFYGGKISGLMGYFIDVTEENLERDRLSKLSNTDELTGVINRRGYGELVDFYEKQYLEDGTDFALFMMDINNFKTINDTYGHEFGNKVLVAVCRNLRRVAAKNSVVVRYGGDEFIILHQFSNPYDLIILMQKITSALASIAEVEDKQIDIRVAIGYDIYSAHKDKIKLIESADAKMYENKRKAKGL